MDQEKGDRESKLGDFFKKIASVAPGALFMTEDILKGVLGDIPLPKDILHQLMQNAKNTKEELYGKAEGAFRDYLQSIDVRKELENVLDQYDIDVQMNFQFKRKNKKHHK